MKFIKTRTEFLNEDDGRGRTKEQILHDMLSVVFEIRKKFEGNKKLKRYSKRLQT